MIGKVRSITNPNSADFLIEYYIDGFIDHKIAYPLLVLDKLSIDDEILILKLDTEFHSADYYIPIKLLSRTGLNIRWKDASIQIRPNEKIVIKNGNMSLKTLLNNMLQMYITTTTLTGEPLSTTSIQKGVDLILDVNKLLE